MWPLAAQVTPFDSELFSTAETTKQLFHKHFVYIRPYCVCMCVLVGEISHAASRPF